MIMSIGIAAVVLASPSTTAAADTTNPKPYTDTLPPRLHPSAAAAAAAAAVASIT